MKRQYILYFSILCALCVGQPAYAQDDESLDEEETVSVPKKKQAKIIIWINCLKNCAPIL